MASYLKFPSSRPSCCTTRQFKVIESERLHRCDGVIILGSTSRQASQRGNNIQLLDLVSHVNAKLKGIVNFLCLRIGLIERLHKIDFYSGVAVYLAPCNKNIILGSKSFGHAQNHHEQIIGSVDPSKLVRTQSNSQHQTVHTSRI